jgi:transposase
MNNTPDSPAKPPDDRTGQGGNYWTLFTPGTWKVLHAVLQLRLAAVSVGRTDTALGAFYRRLSARVGKAKAITATARKIAVLFYNTLRHGMSYADPGATYYEERYKQRVLGNLQRRAKSLGYVL